MYSSHKKVKVYSIHEEEVIVPHENNHIQWHQYEFEKRLAAPSLASLYGVAADEVVRLQHIPIHRFCETVYRGKYTDRWENVERYIDAKSWETTETFVSLRPSDKDGFMKYLTSLIDKARDEKQQEIDALEKKLYHTQMNLECLDNKISKATFWSRLKYLFGGEL